MINLLLFIQDFFYTCQLFDQRLRKILWNISKDISDCYQHKLKINPISIIEVPFKPFMPVNWLNICITDLEV